MLDLVLNQPKDKPLAVLCLGAHCDDIEIGCGGTLLTLAESHPNLSVHWVVLSSNAERSREARGCAELFLEDVPSARIEIEGFRDGYFPYEGAPIKDYFEGLKAAVSPDVVFTHYRNDWPPSTGLIDVVSGMMRV